MDIGKMNLVIVVGVLLYLIFGLTPVIGGTIQRPVIYSYYWPIGKGQQDLLNLNMNTPNFIDIPWQDNPKWLEAKRYWENNGKTILYRVYPFKEIKSEDEMYEKFTERLEEAKGIAIDEIVTHKLTKKQARMFVNVLVKVRHAYPDKIIAVWCSGNWNQGNAFLLKAINDNADMFLPELYISQSVGKTKGFEKFKSYLKSVEGLIPGISKKTIIGIGMYPKMADDQSQNFRDHLSSQIKLLGTDPFFRNLLGVALYAPVYISIEDQNWIDGILEKFFS